LGRLRQCRHDGRAVEALAPIAHHRYRSIDLALRCVTLLRQRGVLADGAEQAYLASLRETAA
jgi:hypothetical protein